MGRFLFVAPPPPASARPAVGVGAELEARGHEVAWAAHPDTAGLLPSPATPFFPVDAAPALTHRAADELRGPAGLRFHWEDHLVPQARRMVPGVRAALRAWEPDVVVADQQALAGAAVAQVARVPWATTLTTAAEVADPVGNLPLVARWIHGLLHDLGVEAGLSAREAAAVDLRLSPYAVVAFSTEALLEGAGLPAHTTYVGPDLPKLRQLTGNSPDNGRNFEAPVVVIQPDPVHVELSRSFVGRALDALAEIGVQAIVSRSADLGRAAAVVDHGTHGDVCTALAAGVPVVVAPIADDQPMMAQQVVDAGAGLRVAIGRADPEPLRGALEHALSDQELLAGAAQVRDSFVRAGGRALAADRIEELLGAEPVTQAGPPSAHQVPA